MLVHIGIPLFLSESIRESEFWYNTCKYEEWFLVHYQFVKKRLVENERMEMGFKLYQHINEFYSLNARSHTKIVLNYLRKEKDSNAQCIESCLLARESGNIQIWNWLACVHADSQTTRQTTVDILLKFSFHEQYLV